MAKSSGKKKEEVKLPGIPFDRFQAGVRALVELRDRGKLLVFLGRRRSVNLVGDRADFLKTLSTKLEGKGLKDDESREVFEEIRRYLSTRIKMANNQQVVSWFVHSRYEDELNGLTTAGKRKFRQQLKDKVTLVEAELYTLALRSREQRFESTTAACLEDVEFEIVEERCIPSQDEFVSDPFLRLKFRYTEGTDLPAELVAMGLFFQGSLRRSGVQSFELECDESDIDLLMLQLDVAKKRLLKARENNDELHND